MKKLLYILVGCLALLGVILLRVESFRETTPMVSSPTPSLTPSPAILPRPIVLNSSVLWTLVNNWRVKAGFKTYTWNEELCELARERMPMVKSTWSHDGFIEATNRRFSKYNDWDVAENLARYYSDESATLVGWLNSPIHRKFLDAEYTYSCVVTSGQYAIETFGNF